jgi:hypothetical protein
LRNVKTGGLVIYNIANNQIAGAAFLGTIGLDWQFAGVAPIHAAGASDLVLRNVNTGAFEVYNIANNQITGAALLGTVGLDWQLGGLAVDPPTGSMGGVGWFNLSARASDGGLWRRQRRSRWSECRRRQCRCFAADISDDTTARVRPFSRLTRSPRRRVIRLISNPPMRYERRRLARALSPPACRRAARKSSGQT